jgi:hypothetical protein
VNVVTGLIINREFIGDDAFHLLLLDGYKLPSPKRDTKFMSGNVYESDAVL